MRLDADRALLRQASRENIFYSVPSTNTCCAQRFARTVVRCADETYSTYYFLILLYEYLERTYVTGYRLLYGYALPYLY